MDAKIIVVLAASLFVFCLLLFLFNFVLKYQKKTVSFLKEKELMQSKFEQALLQSQIEVQEATFLTLSKELHDNVGQLLSTAKMLLGITERNIANPPDTLITANATVGQAINELRSLAKSLNKEWLEQFNLVQNLTNEVSRLNSTDATILHLEHPVKIYLKANEQIILFRIIQEAIQNAVKHACAKNIFININLQDSVLFTSIKDDGKGLGQNEKCDGIGILNMKHRAKLLGGTINWNSSNSGCEVLITLPIKQDEI
jgi:signal transduction histidine kinase